MSGARSGGAEDRVGAAVSGIRRWTLIAVGCTAVALGVVGVFLPLLPTTPFLLLAAWCFARSSACLHRWLVCHPRLGDYVNGFLYGGGMPVRAKVIALVVLWSGLAISAAVTVWRLEDRASVAVAAILLGVGAAVTVFIATRASAPDDAGAAAGRVRPSPCDELRRAGAAGDGRSRPEIISSMTGGGRVDREQLKRQAAAAALEYVRPGMVVGVGTGTTAGHFIDLLAGIGERLAGTVASSEDTARKLAERGIPVLDMGDIRGLPLYVDGADEVDPRLRLIKGGGGALTREKIVASAAELFVCIVDEAKLVPRLGAFPLPLEVLPMARGVVSAAVEGLGGRPQVRNGFVTDNGNLILDVHDLDLSEPEERERQLDALPGVVECGIFAARRADVVISAGAGGVRAVEPV